MPIVISMPRPRSRYGWRPDIPDFRDLPFSMKEVVSLPPIVDLRPWCSTVENQGDLGSCTANALVGALECMEIQKWKKYIDLSRLFVYYNERAIIGEVNNDSGAYIRDGIKTLVRDGVCLEKLWPYDINRFTKKPNDSAWYEASFHKVKRYERLSTLDQYLTCLANSHPFVFGFTVYESFESSTVTQTGVVQMPGPDEARLGGHAVCAVGYNLGTRRFLVRNSWGSEWGDGGYFTMPFAYLTNPSLSDDFWAIYSANV